MSKFNILKSKTLAYYLIVLLLIEVCIGAILPQNNFSFTGYQKLLGSYPQFITILKSIGLLPFFSSWLFIGTMLLFFINTLFCSLEQLGKLIADKSKRLQGWGLVLFHFSLLLIILGSIFTQVMKFEGAFYIAEGQTWTNSIDNYYRYQAGPFFKVSSLPEFQLFLEDFDAVYPLNDYPKQLTSQVKLTQPGGNFEHYTVQAVEPLKYKGFTFHQTGHGYAPEVIMVDAKKDVVLQGIISLSTDTSNGEDYVDNFEIPSQGITLQLRFLPDYAVSNNKYYTKTYRPKNPALVVTVRDKANTILFKGPVIIGGEISFQGYNLKFPAYRKWSGFTSVYDPGYPLIILGFGLGTLGLILMLYRKIFRPN